MGSGRYKRSARTRKMPSAKWLPASSRIRGNLNTKPKMCYRVLFDMMMISAYRKYRLLYTLLQFYIYIYIYYVANNVSIHIKNGKTWLSLDIMPLTAPIWLRIWAPYNPMQQSLVTFHLFIDKQRATE